MGSHLPTSVPRLTFKVEGSTFKVAEMGNLQPRRAFTLPEVLITIAIISLLAGMGLAALGGATQMAREQRTQAMINKIDTLLRERYEDYRTRAVPIKMPTAGTFPPYYAAMGTQQSRANAMLRLFALRALMRMELPDRRSDIVNYTTTPPSLEVAGFTPQLSLSVAGTPYFMQPPALQKTYFRSAVKALGGNPNVSSTYTVLNNWTPENEGAECLYLIMASLRDGDKRALDYFSPDEIGDTDSDGMNEIVDGWGTPITFLRWAPGYCEQPGEDLLPGKANIDDDGNGTTDDITEYGWPDSDDARYLVSTFQTRNAANAPDPFDPARVDPRWSVSPPYALFPLILSAGPDRSYDIQLTLPASFRAAVPPTGLPAVANFPNDPYFIPANASFTVPQLGTPYDEDGDGDFGFIDNLSNHSQQTL